jgi:predicted CXXCH cytochrome family protein
MRNLVLAWGAVSIVFCAALLLTAQGVDSIVTRGNRIPRTIADDILNPAERSAFVALLKTTDPRKLLGLSRSFLQNYPSSAFLALVSEKAARASFDLGELNSGLEYAHFSLVLLPENPFLLVAVADVQARLQQNEAAISSARDALDYLDRFDRPSTISAGEWPALKRKEQASAWFVIGRALVSEALASPAGGLRTSLLQQAASSLLNARDLSPGDMEIVYLLGLDYYYANDWPHAVEELSAVFEHGKQFAPQAREQLQTIWNQAKPAPQTKFEDFVRDLERQAIAAPKPHLNPAETPSFTLSGYAGSETCGRCHTSIYRQWSQSGMSKMFRPYKPENVIGDFEKKNDFYIGDNVVYRNGQLQITHGPGRVLFARMVIRNARHYFEIKQSDGLWHTYPVDYTIGSKWQQAYATKLPNGQIHVFPIQYSALAKTWLNYWKIIDGPGTERANPYNWEKLDASTSYEINCAVCHTSQLRNSRGGGFDTDNLVFREPGVGCEMCHGPGAAHVEEMAAGRLSKGNPLEPPVEFDKISNRDFVRICGQCHMQSNVHAGSPRGELNYSTTGTFFLKNAALPLGEFTRDTFFKDGRFRQTTFLVEALERSKCFRKGQASCGTCHNPHGHNESLNPTSLKFTDQPDLMCLGCHTQFKDKSSAMAHTHHPFDTEASRCVSCHMPRIMDAVLFRARYHQIDDIPDAEMTLRFGQEESPNACMLCHTEKTAQWVKGQLQSWKTTQ